MKPKKSKQANLESRKGMFRQMGIIMALGLTFIAFEYSNADISSPNLYYDTEVSVETDYVPITRDKIKLPPPPPVILDKIVINLNNLAIEEDIEIIDLEPEEIPDFSKYFNDAPEEDSDAPFVVVEEMPEFPGGDAALMRYLGKHVIYPTIAMEMGIQGRVYVEFIINKSGKVTQVQILKSVDKYLDQEALRVVENMPLWKPGRQRGKAVNVSYRIPVNFVLK